METPPRCPNPVYLAEIDYAEIQRDPNFIAKMRQLREIREVALSAEHFNIYKAYVKMLLNSYY